MNKKLKIAVGAIIALLLVDQCTKFLAVKYLTNHAIEVIPKFFHLTLHYNTGMAFSLLENARFLFLPLTVIIVIYGWKYYRLYHQESNWLYLGGMLFFSGTLGNFLDRLFFGKVTDFLSFIFGEYHFAIFNVADMLLVCSVPLILVGVYLYEKRLEEEHV